MTNRDGTYMLHIKDVDSFFLAQAADDHHIAKDEQVALGELAQDAICKNSMVMKKI